MEQTNCKSSYATFSYAKVIYDTLISQSEPMEVVAVLAHELGHWANWDTTRQLLIAEVWKMYFIANWRYICFRSSSCSLHLLKMGACIKPLGLQTTNQYWWDYSFSMTFGNQSIMSSSGQCISIVDATNTAQVIRPTNRVDSSRSICS